MQALLDFINMLWSGISQAAKFTGYFISRIPSLYSAFINFLASVPVWIVAPVTAAVVLAIVLQIISFIPTESGGKS